jgi:type IV pilus assembly protein PilC
LLAPPVLIVAFILARRTPSLGVHIDHAILRLPLLGKAFRDHANTMWCRTLGALLRSGIDILAALELVGGIVGNQYYTVQFTKMREIVRQGGSLTRGLESTRLHALCPMSLTMVSVSEEAGGLDESLLHVARYSEEQLARRVALLGKLVEPAIFIIVGGMVGFIYFAFFMAMLAVTKSAR